MTPVMQTIFSIPGGDCFRACVASIFNIPIEVVPNFLGDAEKPDATWRQDQWDAVREFAEKHNTRATHLDPDTEQEWVALLESSGIYYIATGRSPLSGFGHCVVMRSGVNVHDPMPTKKFIENPWLYVFFVDVLA